MSAAHVHTDPTIPAPDPHGPWLAVSAALTSQAPTLTGREDLIVTCAPGAGRGSPGVFFPALATIEIDGVHLPDGVDPTTISPDRPSDRDRYPALWGVFIHEAAHATHTVWAPPPGQNATPAADAAKILEESRAEAAHLTRRPADLHWLRAAISQIVLPAFASDDPTPAPDPGGPDLANPDFASTAPPAVGMSPSEAARAAGLLLARVDTGVLDLHETTDLETIIAGVLGADTLALLRGIWETAHTVADDDADTMMILGELWAEVVGDTPPPPPHEEPRPDGTPSPLSDAISGIVREVTGSTAPTTTSLPGTAALAASRTARDSARRATTGAAKDVFGEGGGTAAAGRDEEPDTFGPTALRGKRPPTDDEHTAARRLARTLRDASQGTRVSTTITSKVPPGRLRMRGALTADAQRAAGTLPTAEPFSRTRRRRVPNPPLHLGIACDVSGSMSAFAAPVASTAWITAAAAAHIPDTRTATVIFGEKVRPIIYPGAAPTQVTEFYAFDGTERFVKAVDALTGALDLATAKATRMLVVISDGEFTARNLTDGQQRLDRLAASGCHLLWILPGPSPDPMRGVQVVTMTNPADTATAIATAITRTLTHP
ncbi:VWA domain-containing protein [Frankia sp. ACN1ag]|uniref:VWA domain-containing protein n=1 Tax=Frankia sp. ACN1ag TaxID=102891 RepID=UPI0006DD06FA|nr:VWA domain-containing protein [Frankia sp. ACN1ag]KQC37908.1 hypothetical protein UK82_13015 [Frankia sp. ACN1ag]